MFLKITGALGCAVLFAALSQPSFARGKSSTGATNTVTGCVAQGPQPNQYVIKADNGKTYELTSSKVDIAKHVGHKVTVTGSTMSMKEKSGTSNTSSTMPEEHLKVRELKMVSTSCQ